MATPNQIIVAERIRKRLENDGNLTFNADAELHHILSDSTVQEARQILGSLLLTHPELVDCFFGCDVHGVSVQ